MQNFKKVTLGNSRYQTEHPQVLRSFDGVSRSKTSPAEGNLSSYLFKASSGSFLIQVGFAGLAFLNSFILARLLGTEGYGAFSNAMAWVSLLLIPASFGFGTLIVREVAIYRSRHEWGHLRGLLRFADILNLGLSCIFAIVLVSTALMIFHAPERENMKHTLIVAAPLIPLFALLKIRESASRGLEHVIRAQLPEMIFRPGLFLLGMVALYITWPEHLSTPTAMGINVIAAAVALAVSTLWLKMLLPSKAKYDKPESKPITWLKAAFPMLIYGSSQIMLGQTDIIMLGGIRGDEETGLYTAASRFAYLLVYVMISIEVILAPIMARLYYAKKKEQLQKILTRRARIAFLTVLPLGLALILGGRRFLAIFGPGFLVAQSVLAILAFGRLIDVAAGSGALLLGMTGYEGTVAVVLSGSVLGNVLLNALLIPRYGAGGAAVASVIILVSAKLLLSIYAVKRTGVHVTIFGAWSKSLPVRLNKLLRKYKKVSCKQ